MAGKEGIAFIYIYLSYRRKFNYGAKPFNEPRKEPVPLSATFRHGSNSPISSLLVHINAEKGRSSVQNNHSSKRSFLSLLKL